jgi:hypothetical protein
VDRVVGGEVDRRTVEADGKIVHQTQYPATTGQPSRTRLMIAANSRRSVTSTAPA